jgi:hypothetical protein
LNSDKLNNLIPSLGLNLLELIDDNSNCNNILLNAEASINILSNITNDRSIHFPDHLLLKIYLPTQLTGFNEEINSYIYMNKIEGFNRLRSNSLIHFNNKYYLNWFISKSTMSAESLNKKIGLIDLSPSGLLLTHSMPEFMKIEYLKTIFKELETFKPNTGLV